MHKVQPLFIVGNKRSGTSLLVELLNLHPNVFVSNESDIVWILYQMRTQNPVQYRCYPWDGPLGMEATLRACHSILEASSDRIARQGEVLKVFLSVQKYLMKYGSSVQKAFNKNRVGCLGDKKPVQHGDPELREFIKKNFTNGRFLHIIRHPRSVVRSMMCAAKKWTQGVPQYWKQTPMEILERWAIHEKWVLQEKSMRPNKIHTLRLEDLCKKPEEIMAGVFEFLGEEMLGHIAEHFEALIKINPNDKYDSFYLPSSPDADRIMDMYGYR